MTTMDGPINLSKEKREAIRTFGAGLKWQAQRILKAERKG